MDGMIESFKGRHESDITVKAGGKWKYNGEKGGGAGWKWKQQKHVVAISLLGSYPTITISIQWCTVIERKKYLTVNPLGTRQWFGKREGVDSTYSWVKQIQFFSVPSKKVTQQLICRAPENNGEGGGRGSSPIQLDTEQHIYCWDKL